MLLFFISIIYCAQAINELSEGNILTIKKLIKESEIRKNFFEEGHKGVIYFYKAKKIFPHIKREDIEKLNTIKKATVDRTRSIENGVAKLRELSEELSRGSSIPLVCTNVFFLQNIIQKTCDELNLVAIKEKEDFDSFSELLKVDLNQQENIERFDELCKVFNIICFNRNKYVDIHQRISNQINEILSYFNDIAITNLFTLEMFPIQRNSSEFYEIICDNLCDALLNVEENLTVICNYTWPEHLILEKHYDVIIFTQVAVKLYQIYNQIIVPLEQNKTEEEKKVFNLKEHFKKILDFDFIASLEHINFKIILLQKITDDCKQLESLHEVLDAEYKSCIDVIIDDLKVAEKEFEEHINTLLDRNLKFEEFCKAVMDAQQLLDDNFDLYYENKFKLWLNFTLKTSITSFLEDEIKILLPGLIGSDTERGNDLLKFFKDKNTLDRTIEEDLGFNHYIFTQFNQISDFYTLDNFTKLEFLTKAGQKIISKKKR